jgi:chromosomal replication initiation ATPase DnaA
MMPSTQILVSAVCCACEVETTDVLGSRRFRELADARAIIWALQVDLLRTCKSAVARMWGVDHTTVLHGIKRARRLVKVDPGFRAKWNASATMARNALRIDAERS